MSAVGHAYTGATDQIFMPIFQHVARQAGPQLDDDAAGAVIRVYARAPDFNNVVAQVREPRKVEFLFRVITTGGPRCQRRQDAVGSHHLRCLDITHQQVLAIRVKPVHIQSRGRRFEFGAHFLGKNHVTQTLRLRHLRPISGETHRQPPPLSSSCLQLFFQHRAPPYFC